MGVPSAWVGAAKSRSGWQRTEPSAQNQSRERDAGKPGTPASRALEARLLAAASAEERPRGRNFLPLPALHPALSAPGPSWGAPATLCAPRALSPRGTWPSSPSKFLPPAAGSVALRCSDASVPGVQHWGRAGSRVSSSTVAFHSISAFLCLYLSVSESVSFSNSLAYRIRSGFVSLSFSFPLFFLGCSRVSVTLSFPLSLCLTLFFSLYFFSSRCLSPLISPA